MGMIQKARQEDTRVKRWDKGGGRALRSRGGGVQSTCGRRDFKETKEKMQTDGEGSVH